MFLGPEELEQRRKLGLIRTSAADPECYKLKKEIEREEKEERKENDENLIVKNKTVNKPVTTRVSNIYPSY
jgi:hypothetical protein